MWSVVMSQFMLRACVLMHLNKNTCGDAKSFSIERETM